MGDSKLVGLIRTWNVGDGVEGMRLGWIATLLEVPQLDRAIQPTRYEAEAISLDGQYDT